MFRRLMYVCLLSLGLKLICCPASVKAQSHSCQYSAALGWQCGDGEICCGGKSRLCVSTSKLPSRHCSCVYRWDCNHDEYCWGYSCKKSSTVQPSTVKPSTVKRSSFQLSTLKPVYCDSDSSCLGGDRICQDGRCVMKAYNSSFLDDPGSLVVYIIGMTLGILAVTGFIVYYIVKLRRKLLSMHPPTERNTLPTEVATPRANEHETQSVANEREMQPGVVAATSSTVVSVENNAPFLPGAPPPYHSLEFQRQQENRNESLSEQSPPCYEAVVREIMI